MKRDNLEMEAVYEGLIAEEELEQKMAHEVEPCLRGIMRSGFLEGGRLYYELFPLEKSKGTVVISFGFTESCRKFHEMIYYFLKAGYQCAVMDHRGHGSSAREGKDPNVVHVEKFEQYVTDFRIFVQEAVMPMKEGRLYLYGHSMGGCIAARYLERWPCDFDRAVLNAPMLGLKLGRMPFWAAAFVCDMFIFLGKGKERLFFHKEFCQDEPFRDSCASSRARHEYYQKLRCADPSLQTSSASYRWVREAIRAGRRVDRKKEAEKVGIPVLLFQAGEDTLVSDRAQLKFLKRIKDGTLIRAEHSKHEIYRSGNEILGPYLKAIMDFFR